MLFIRDRKTNIKKSIFELIAENTLNIYVCGPTLYRKPHIGNFRSVIFVDYIVNLMHALNIKTKIYSSITDIGHCEDEYGIGDDKVMNTANKLTIKYYNVVHKYFMYYMSILSVLNINRQINYIAASSIIEEYISHIDIGLKKDILYFDEDKNIRVKQNFINKNSNEMIFSGSRLKEFVVWKHDKNGIAKYKDNIGNPGWHIECFCIINKYFKNSNNNFKVDIHIGGIDLLDIHNNAEIIHSKIVDNEYNLSKCWLAIGTIKKDGKKLSKSDNNVIYLDEFVEKYNVSILKIIIFNANIESDIDINCNTIKYAENIYNSAIDKIANIIFKNFENPNINFNNIMFKIRNSAMQISLDINSKFNTRHLLNNIVNVKSITDLYYAYLYDSLLNTQIFASIESRQKEASKFLYLQSKRIKFQSDGDYNTADLLRKQILDFSLRIIESENRFFIY